MSNANPPSHAHFSLRGLSFAVPGRTLLYPLDFSFPPGQVCGLIGHNGSGKSTLLKILGRHQSASSGEARLNDRPLAEWDSKAFARQVAYLPQQLPAAEGMTVRELVALGRYPWHGALGRFSLADREHVLEAIELVGLDAFADRLVDSLSGGERQRAWLAMTMAQRLSRQRGLTVIAVLHDINMAARYCDHLAALREGRLIAEGSPSQLMCGEVLERIYGIPMGILPHPGGGAPVSFVY